MKKTKTFGIIACAAIIVFSMAGCAQPSDPVITPPILPPASAAAPVISVQPANTAWDISADNVKTLTVTASVTDGGVISYQWYKSASNSAAGGIAISEQTSATLSLAKADYGTNGDYYFYVVVTNTNNNATTAKTAVTTSAAAMVTVTGGVALPVNAATPVIGVQPANTAWDVSVDNVKTLTVTASVTDGGVISYQWYKSASGNAAGGTAISAQTSATLSLAKADYGTNGDYYFYVVVTNTNDNATGDKTVSVSSAVATVTVTGGVALPVNAATPVIGVQPANTAWDVSVDNVKTLTVTASVTDGGVISYQWYKSAGGSAAGGTAISGQTSAALSLAKADYSRDGDYYFYVVVTNTNDNATGDKTAGVTSAVATVTVIGNLAFTLIFPSDTAYKVARGTSTAAVVVIPTAYNGKPVTEIAYQGFSGYTAMTSITIPDSVTEIGSFAFADCSGLTSITVDSGNAVYKGEGNCLIKIATNQLIAGCKTSVIPDSVTSIGLGAFQGCSGLTSITISAGVTNIGFGAFAGCSGLTSVTIGSGVTGIQTSAFYGCSSLTSVTIGSGVTSIGVQAFAGCSGLTSVTFEGTIASSQFSETTAFPGDLRAKFYATDSTNGTPGTYTTTAPVSLMSVWTKQS